MSMKPISTGCLRKNAKTDEVKGNEKSVQTTLYLMAVPMGRCASLRTGIEGYDRTASCTFGRNATGQDFLCLVVIYWI